MTRAPDISDLLGRLVSATPDAFITTGKMLGARPPSDTFALGHRLAENEDRALQAALAGWLRAAGERDPEALSVFLAQNAHVLPISTINAAGKALPEVG